MKNLFSKLRPFDYIIIFYCLLTGIYITLGFNKISHVWIHLFLRLLILIITLTIVFKAKEYTTISKFIRNFYPLLFLAFFYSETGYYNQLLFTPFDPYLVKFEDFIFGFQPSIEFSQLISYNWFSELMHFGYFSFYLMIIVVPLIYFIKLPEKFNEIIFIVLLSFCLYYITFILFPSVGPQFYFSSNQVVVPNGFLFTNIMNVIISIAETPTGAFPSSHVGMNVVFLILIWKHFKPYFKYLLLFSVILILSTIYLKAHYVVDIIGGLISGSIFYFINTTIYKRIELKQNH